MHSAVVQQQKLILFRWVKEKKYLQSAEKVAFFPVSAQCGLFFSTPLADCTSWNLLGGLPKMGNDGTEIEFWRRAWQWQYEMQWEKMALMGGKGREREKSQGGQILEHRPISSYRYWVARLKLFGHCLTHFDIASTIQVWLKQLSFVIIKEILLCMNGQMKERERRRVIW